MSISTAARRPGQLAGGGDPVEPRHADVHQHHVRAQPARLADRLAAVGGLPEHLDPLAPLEDRAQADADEVLVVGDQHRRHAAPSSGSRARTTNSPPAGPALKSPR